MSSSHTHNILVDNNNNNSDEESGMRSRNHSSQQHHLTPASMGPTTSSSSIPISTVVSNVNNSATSPVPTIDSSSNTLKNLAVLPPAVLKISSQHQQHHHHGTHDSNINIDDNNDDDAKKHDKTRLTSADGSLVANTTEDEHGQLIPAEQERNDDDDHGDDADENAIPIDHENDTKASPQQSFDSQLPRAFFSYPPSPLSFLDVTKNLTPQFLAAYANTTLFFLGTNLIIAAVGRNFSTLSLAAVGGGISLNNILGYSFSMGFLGALESLCSASYGRLKAKAERGKPLTQKDVHEVGELTLLGMILSTILCIPFAILFWNSTPIIRAIFGEQYVSMMQTYLLYAIPNLFAACYAQALVKSCQSQQRADICAIATVVTAIVSFISSITLVPWYGVEGTALAISLNSIVVVVMIYLLAYLDSCFFKRRRFVVTATTTTDMNDDDDDELEAEEMKSSSSQKDSTESSSNKDAVDDKSVNDEDKHLKPEVLFLHVNLFNIVSVARNIFRDRARVKEFITVGMNTAAQVCAEWLSFEVWLLISSRLGPESFAAFQIFMSITVMAFAFTCSVGVAASSWVGGLLGENKPLAAFTHAKTCIIWAASLGLFAASIVRVFHETLFGFYTHDAAVIAHLKNLLTIFFAFVVLDHSQFTIQAAGFRGTNMNHAAPKIVLTSLWCIGLPCSYFGSHYGDLFGLIAGYLVGLSVEIPLLIRKMNTFNWDQLALTASKEQQQESISSKE